MINARSLAKKLFRTIEHWVDWMLEAPESTTVSVKDHKQSEKPGDWANEYSKQKLYQQIAANHFVPEQSVSVFFLRFVAPASLTSDIAMAVPTGPATTYDELAAYMAQCAITLASSGRDVQEVMEILRCVRDSFEAVRRSSDEDREDAEVQCLGNYLWFQARLDRFSMFIMSRRCQFNSYTVTHTELLFVLLHWFCIWFPGCFEISL